MMNEQTNRAIFDHRTNLLLLWSQQHQYVLHTKISQSIKSAEQVEEVKPIGVVKEKKKNVMALKIKANPRCLERY